MNNNRNVSTFSPFITFCQYVIPLAYDESMSYYETLCALRNYLVNTVIPAVNNNADAVTELQDKYTEFTNNINNTVQEFENYIDNYFNNLDVQTEINNKLDQMAEDGQLQDIIAQYLELASVLAFNTRADLKSANNLNEGSFTYCYGKTIYNDGYGAFYKIRKSINTDVADDENLIALTNYPNLIAEKMPNNYLNDVNNNLTEQINTINNTTIPNIQNDITELDEKIENYEKTKITLIIGDSWTDPRPVGNSYRDGATSWVETFKTFTKDTVINTAMSGTGFYQKPNAGDMNFDEQYMSVINNEEYDNSLIDTIIVYGGLNDIDNTTYDNIKNGAINLLNHIKQYTPYAKVYIAFYNHPNRLITYDEQYDVNALSNDLLDYNIRFVKAGGWCLGKDGTFASDNYHPNATGNKQILQCILAMLNGTEGFEIPLQVSNMRLREPASLHITYPNSTVVHNITYNPYKGLLHGQFYWYNFPTNTQTEPSTTGDPDYGSVTFGFDINFVQGLDNQHYSPTQSGSAIAPKTASTFMTTNFNWGGKNTSVALDYNVYIATVKYTGIAGKLDINMF